MNLPFGYLAQSCMLVPSRTRHPDNSQYRRRSNIAIIKTGSIYIVVGTSSPTPNLEGTGIDPREMDIVMVKQGYLVNQWYNMKADWVMALTRGGVDQDFQKHSVQEYHPPYVPIRSGHAGPRTQCHICTFCQTFIRQIKQPTTT